MNFRQGSFLYTQEKRIGGVLDFTYSSFLVFRVFLVRLSKALKDFFFKRDFSLLLPLNHLGENCSKLAFEKKGIFEP